MCHVLLCRERRRERERERERERYRETGVPPPTTHAVWKGEVGGSLDTLAV
jgi:hypothetical protein